MKKIYSDDPLVHYKGSTVSPERTMREIDAKLREYGVVDIHWHWRPEACDVYVQFGIEEVIDGFPVRVAAQVVCPTIWDKAKLRSPKRENRVEKINLQLSMRAMWWYIKTHLESAYAMQSSRVAAFLPDMVTKSGNRYFDTLKSQLDKFPALEYAEAPEQRDVEIVLPSDEET